MNIRTEDFVKKKNIFLGCIENQIFLLESARLLRPSNGNLKASPKIHLVPVALNRVHMQTASHESQTIFKGEQKVLNSSIFL